MEMRLPILILTGFLGSGKTTLLNRLLSQVKDSDTAILVNEFGEIGVDHLLVDRISEDIVLLNAGCVCCSVRDDLTASLLDLYRRRSSGQVPPFKRVVLETTGIADPSSIVQALAFKLEIQSYYYPATIVTVVDTTLGLHTIENFPEAIRQIALADRVILSKTDLASAEQIAKTKEKICNINPHATIESSVHSPCLDTLVDFEPVAANPPWPQVDRHQDDSLLTDRDSMRFDETRYAHGARFATFVVDWDNDAVNLDLVNWLDQLLAARGDSILRIKGVVQLHDPPGPHVVQAVQHVVYPLTPHYGRSRREIEKNELVFITQDFSRAAAIQSLKPFVRAKHG